jgi:hypothetical protein
MMTNVVCPQTPDTLVLDVLLETIFEKLAGP